MKKLASLITLLLVTGCGQSELDRCIETNEKIYSESFSNMKIELTENEIKDYVNETQEMLDYGNTPYHLERFANKILKAWSRNDFEEIQNLYHSDLHSKKLLTYGYLKEFAEKWIEDFCDYQIRSSWCVEDLSTYENISLINEKFISYDGYPSIGDLEIQIYLRFYNKDNFKENMFNYARSLCHSQGVY